MGPREFERVHLQSLISGADRRQLPPVYAEIAGCNQCLRILMRDSPDWHEARPGAASRPDTGGWVVARVVSQDVGQMLHGTSVLRLALR